MADCKALKLAVIEGSVDRARALAQVAAGAQIPDVNVGYPGVDEPRMIVEAIKAVIETVDVPICLDSANPSVMESGLSIYRGKMILSSVTGEADKMKRILPLAREHGTALVAMCMDEDGIPPSAEARLAIARRIVETAERLSIPREDIIVDCACMAVATDPTPGHTTLETIRLVRADLGCNITIGASNVSFGFPDRRVLNAAFLPNAIAAGVNCPIVGPTVPEAAKAIQAADVLLNKDEYGMNYIRAYRARQAADGGA